MLEVFELAEGVGFIADLVVGIARGLAEGTPSAFDDVEDPHPGPPVPEPPPPRLPDSGWEQFAPQPRPF